MAEEREIFLGEKLCSRDSSYYTEAHDPRGDRLMQAVEEKFHLSGEYSTFEDFRSSSKEASKRSSILEREKERRERERAEGRDFRG